MANTEYGQQTATLTTKTITTLQQIVNAKSLQIIGLAAGIIVILVHWQQVETAAVFVVVVAAVVL
jgi:hypothetical protein